MTITVIFFDLGNTLVTRDPAAWLPNAQALLSDLRQSKFRLGVISNTGNDTRVQLLKLLPVGFDFNAFDADLVLLSSEVGAKKPQKAIFDEAVKRAKVPADQCLFCTEDIVDTLMAQQSGMRTIRVQPPPNSELDKLQEAIAEFQALVKP
jgi:putative hydrolase of the HAD superfamily